VETRYDNETNEYVAVVVRPEGRQQTERFLRGKHSVSGSRRWSARIPESGNGGYPTLTVAKVTVGGGRLQSVDCNHRRP